MRRVISLAALLAAIGLAAPGALARSSSGKKREADKKRPTITHRSNIEGGRHWRIKTPHGAVHVWVPRGYRRGSAGTVVYVHGYGTKVDYAWKHHQLAKQFRKSRQNALFIVPEAPIANADSVKWRALGDLKRAVLRAGIRLPNGPAIAIGHSGAIRTLSQWVDNRLLAQIILLDANYGRDQELAAFIHEGKRARHHKMVVVANDTIDRAKRFIKQYPYAVMCDKIPDSYRGFKRRQKRTKLLYIRSQYGHMQIVTSGKVIPLLLRLTPLVRL